MATVLFNILYFIDRDNKNLIPFSESRWISALQAFRLVAKTCSVYFFKVENHYTPDVYSNERWNGVIF